MTIKLCGITNVDDARAAVEAGADWVGLNMVAGPRRIEIDAVREIVTRLPDANRVVVLVALDFIQENRHQGYSETEACASGSQNQSRDRKGAGNVDTTRTQADTLLDALFAIGVRRLQLYGSVTPADFGRLGDRGFETILVHHVGDEDALTGLDALRIEYAEFWDKRRTGSAGASPSPCASTGNRDGRAGAPPDYLLFDAADAKQLGGTGRRANWEAIIEGRDEDRRAPWPPFLLAGGLNPGNVADAVRKVRPFGVDVSSGVESSPGIKDAGKMRRFVSEARAAFANLKRGH